MSPVENANFDRARRLASTAHVLAIVAVVMLSLAILAQYYIPAGALLWHGETPFHDRLNAALTQLIPSLPLMLFVGAMLKLRQALELYSDGGFFSQKAAGHVAAAGLEAALAITAQILIAPTLLEWVGGGRGVSFQSDPIMVGMFAFALFVMLIGRVLHMAAAIKAENEEIV